jgi:hypothetical protein
MAATFVFNDNGTMTINYDGLPYHNYGPFPNPNNPNTVTGLSESATINLRSGRNSKSQNPVKTPLGVIGFALNGVVLFNPSAGSGGNPPAGYNYNAASEYSLFGEDSCGAHPQQDGQYHYHDAHFLDCWINSEKDEIAYYDGNLRYPGIGGIGTGHSKIIGWALDGYPIYGPYGHQNPLDDTSPVVRMQSSYALRTTRIQVGTNQIPSTTLYPLGTFIQDYVYTVNSGSLDSNNGRYCVTPDFPSGTYAYFLTINESLEPQFPYIIGEEFHSDPIFIPQSNRGGPPPLPPGVPPRPIATGGTNPTLLVLNETYPFSIETPIQPPTPTEAPGSGAVLDPVFNDNGVLIGVNIIDGGEDYDSNNPPYLTVVDAGDPQRPCVLQPLIENGKIINVKILDRGSGYKPLKVKLEGVNPEGIEEIPQGAKAKAVLNESGGIDYVEMVANGDSYFGDVIAEVIGGEGDGAEIVAINGFVTGLSVVNSGREYNQTSTSVVISGGGGTEAKGVVSVDPEGVVTSITIDNPGEFYQTPPVALLTGGGGSGAKALVNIDLGSLDSIDVVDGGGGYKTAPSVVFTRNSNLKKINRNRLSYNTTVYYLTGLLADVGRTDTTIYVDNTDPFPGSGYIFIGNEIINYTGKTQNSFTGCNRGYNFRFEQQITLDVGANDENGISQYQFDVRDPIVRLSEITGNKRAIVYDWKPASRDLFVIFEIDELAFIDAGRANESSNVVRFFAGIANSSGLVDPHIIIPATTSNIVQLLETGLVPLIEQAFQDLDENNIADLINTDTDYENQVNLDGGIASSLYGLEETTGGSNTTLFQANDEIKDSTTPAALTAKVVFAGGLNDGYSHISYIKITLNNVSGTFVVGDTVESSLSNKSSTVYSWDSNTNTLIIKSSSFNPNSPLYLIGESMNGSGATGIIRSVDYETFVRNEYINT